ncbi:Imm30 family immunity protein [Oceanobacillus sp. CFH 90083]|uniref:Imm30 family immunity protein n=1 Tax=Oceanobacillus sp. CFH 90083 TaxID=2592336 RepID=UPI00128DE890|nr:Imm30 family immunity protein [Oceanobacillus sp. CFH 90083]
MDVKSELNKIYTNRLLQSQEEIDAFEEALGNLIGLEDKSVITELCMGFDDDTEQYEVMFGLVHGIEHLYKEKIEEGLYLIAIAVPSVIDRAREWMEVLHYRILNQEQVRKIYGSVLSKLDDNSNEIIMNLLRDIKSEDPDMFSNSVDEVLKAI